jgi:hypothetical protein
MGRIKNTQIGVGAVTVIVAALAMLGFEVVNFLTTQEVLNLFLGNLFFLGLSAGTWLAFAAAAIDTASLARIVTPNQFGEEPREITAITIGWAIAAVINAGLTWWALDIAIRQVPQEYIPTVLWGSEWLIAVIGALFIFSIRIVLIWSFALMADRYVHVTLPNLSGATKKSGRPATAVADLFPKG